MSSMIEERREYILPVRFDISEVLGLPKDVSYIDASNFAHVDLAKAILKKLRINRSTDTVQNEQETDTINCSDIINYRNGKIMTCPYCGHDKTFAVDHNIANELGWECDACKYTVKESELESSGVCPMCEKKAYVGFPMNRDGEDTVYYYCLVATTWKNLHPQAPVCNTLTGGSPCSKRIAVKSYPIFRPQ